MPMPVPSPDKRGGYSYDRSSKPVVEKIMLAKLTDQPRNQDRPIEDDS